MATLKFLLKEKIPSFCQIIKKTANELKKFLKDQLKKIPKC